ncbi:hypothetical protein ACFL2Z_01000 [Candidatus Eisenbacteria bacterium]|uniref:Uncharacterized protein n=1 Tax=Eiseniibacteriota bacterium TaxID=2212470 RepID=A0ABV6YN31_UNCEI
MGPTVSLDKSSLQPPFRQRNLLTVSAFIRHCSKHGIRVTADELEYFEKEGLLFPAVRVHPGVIAFRRVLADFKGRGVEEWRYVLADQLAAVRRKWDVKKVERQKYYGRGGLHTGEDGWLDWHLERDMVIDPAREQFRPWKSYENRGHYVRNPDDLAGVYEAFYCPLQMYPLNFVQSRRVVRITNENLLLSTEEWTGMRKTLAKMFDKGRAYPGIRERVAEYHTFFALFINVEVLWEIEQKDLWEFYEVEIKEWESPPREARDTVRHHRLALEKQLGPRAKEIFRESGLSMKELENWRLSFLTFGTFGLRSRTGFMVRQYLKHLEDYDLAETEDPYRIVNILNWFIGLCGGKRTTIKELILHFSGKHCTVCGRPFEPRKRTQKTCGAESCKKEHKNQLKRKGRKTGLYGSRGR